MDNQGIFYEENKSEHRNIKEYTIIKPDTAEFEELKKINPTLVEEDNIKLENPGSYYFVPLNQLASNLLVIAFEPKSILGFIQSNKSLIEKDGKYKILFVIK